MRGGSLFTLFIIQHIYTFYVCMCNIIICECVQCTYTQCVLSRLLIIICRHQTSSLAACLPVPIDRNMKMEKVAVEEAAEILTANIRCQISWCDDV